VIDPSDETMPPEAPATIPAPPPDFRREQLEHAIHEIASDPAVQMLTNGYKLTWHVEDFNGFASEALDDDA